MIKLYVKFGEQFRQADASDVFNAVAELKAGELIAQFEVEGPTAAYRYICEVIGHRQVENLGVLWLSADHKVISFDILSEGTLTQNVTYGRELVRKALDRNAAFAILTHNHPIGCTVEPSDMDKAMTAKVGEALQTIDVALVDHVIVSGDKWRSMRAEHEMAKAQAAAESGSGEPSKDGAMPSKEEIAEAFAALAERMRKGSKPN